MRLLLILLLSCAPALAAVEVLRPFVPGVHGMALGPDGHLYFSDSFGALGQVRRVYRLAPPFTGEPVPTKIEAALPAGLCWHGERLLVCDTQGNRVRVYDRRLQLQAEWPVPSPWNLRPTPHDGYWVVSHANQAMLLRRGIVIKTLPGLLAPFDTAVTPDGSLWISEQGVRPGDPGRVRRHATDGATLQALDYPFANPEGLALDAAGRLAIAETERGELLELAPGAAPRVLAKDLGLPVLVVPFEGGWLVSTSGAAARLLRVKRE